jgi:pilin isopeptide linkage protein
MKKRGLFSRIAALSMAAILAAAPTSVVFAAGTDPVGSTTGDAIASMNFDKKVEADDNTYQPKETFAFEVTAADSNTYNEQTTYAGIDGGVTVNTVSTDLTKKGTVTYTGDNGGKFTFVTGTFTQPGIYHYTVKETKGSNTHITYDSTTKDLYVYVRRNATSNAIEVYGAALVDKDGTSKTDTFNNAYKYNKPDTPDTEFKDLTVTKTVAGAQGDDEKMFDFTLDMTSVDGRTSYVVSDPNKGDQVLTVGTTYKFQLKNGQTLTVKNLAAGDTYTVKEAQAANYETTAKLNSADYALGTASTMDEKLNAVAVTNTRDAATPTGIIMNVAPYVIMILIAAAAAVLFFRKRRSAE